MGTQHKFVSCVRATMCSTENKLKGGAAKLLVLSSGKGGGRTFNHHYANIIHYSGWMPRACITELYNFHVCVLSLHPQVQKSTIKKKTVQTLLTKASIVC